LDGSGGEAAGGFADWRSAGEDAMNGDTIRHQLEAIAHEPDFDRASWALTDSWAVDGFELEVVEVVMRFIESHPHIDYGMPGSLVHFIERFYGPKYVELLIESLNRRPTFLTTWMLNRALNVTLEPASRSELIEEMWAVSMHPLADDNTVQLALEFADYQSD
jgi:hypothetical protein